MEKIGTPVSEAEWGGKEKCGCACYINQCKYLKINKLWSLLLTQNNAQLSCLCLQSPQKHFHCFPVPGSVILLVSSASWANYNHLPNMFFLLFIHATSQPNMRLNSSFHIYCRLAVRSWSSILCIWWLTSSEPRWKNGMNISRYSWGMN